MTWTFSPVAFTLAIGAIHRPVHWYGLFFASTFVCGIFIFRWMYRLEGRPPHDVYDLVLVVIGGTLIGARLAHVLFYDPGYYLRHPWKIAAVWEGGLASHGAVLGILVAVWIYSRTKPDQGFLWICDRIGLSVPLSGCLIRIGNFLNSEILGRPADVPWGVVFARIDDIPRHPVQLYEALCYLVIFLVQFGYYRARHGRIPEGYLFGSFFILVFGSRFVLEFFKEHQTSFESGWSWTLGQWLSLPAVMTGIFLVVHAIRSEVCRNSREYQDRGADAPRSESRWLR